MTSIRTAVGKNGRIVVPAHYRRSLGLKPGDEVVLVLEENEIRLMSVKEAVRRAQAVVRRYIPAGRSLVDELIRERREEAGAG